MPLTLVLALAAVQAPAAAPAPDLNKKICKAGAKTGSRLGVGSICKTRAQWDAESRANQDDNADLLGKPGAGSGPGS